MTSEQDDDIQFECHIIDSFIADRLHCIADEDQTPFAFASALLSKAAILAAGLNSKQATADYLEDLAAKLRAVDGVAGRA